MKTTLPKCITYLDCVPGLCIHCTKCHVLIVFNLLLCIKFYLEYNYVWVVWEICEEKREMMGGEEE